MLVNPNHSVYSYNTYEAALEAHHQKIKSTFTPLSAL